MFWACVVSMCLALPLDSWLWHLAVLMGILDLLLCLVLLWVIEKALGTGKEHCGLVAAEAGRGVPK